MNKKIKDNLSVLVTPVSISCNFSCLYCFHRDSQKRNLGTGYMSFDTLELLIEQAVTTSSRVRFIWHGGEPTLAGLKFFRRAMQIQSRFDIEFCNSIQTNGTLLNSEWIDFFRDHKFHVGVSIDGPEIIHDSQRIYRDGSGTFTDVKTFIESAIQKNLDLGAICVVTKNSVGREEIIYNFITKYIKSFNFLPYYEANPSIRKESSLTITPQEYAKFMIRIFDLWLEHDNPSINIRILAQWVRAVLGLDITVCRFNGTCAEYITVDANGDVYPCDRFNGEHELRYGNIKEKPLDEMVTGKQLNKFTDQINKLSNECRNCCWWSVCLGDCTEFRYIGDGKFTSKSYYCESQKMILNHVYHKISSFVTAIEEENQRAIINEWW